MSKTSGFKVAVLAASIALAMGSTAVMAATAPAATQLPGEGAVVAGSAGVNTVSTPAPVVGIQTQTIDLKDGNTVINWGSKAASTNINSAATGATLGAAQPGGFNIGSGAELDFTNTTAGGAAVLNVDVNAAGNPSQIFGTLMGTGVDVFVANVNGIIVGANATISSTTGNVGLIANKLGSTTAFDGTNATLDYDGVGGDVTVAKGATISAGTGKTVLIAGGGNVNVDLGGVTGVTTLSAGLPQTTGSFSSTNKNANLAVTGNSTTVSFASAGNASTSGTVTLGASDVAGTLTNNGALTLGTGFAIDGGLVNNKTVTAADASFASVQNNGTYTGTGALTVTDGDFANSGKLTAESLDVQAGNLTNNGTTTVSGDAVTGAGADVSVTDGNLVNNGTITSAGVNTVGLIAVDGALAVTNGSITNGGKLVGFNGVSTATDGMAKTAVDYSITNAGAISSGADSLTINANSGATDKSTGSFTNTGSLDLVGDLAVFALNDLNLGGSVTSAGKALSAKNAGLNNVELVAGGVLTDSAALFFNGDGNNDNAWFTGDQVKLMANVTDANAADGVKGGNVIVTAGAAPEGGDYAVRVGSAATITADWISVNGDAAGDNPNVILQGTLAANQINLGSMVAVSDVFSGPAGGLSLYAVKDNLGATVLPVLDIAATGRVKTAPYLNDANNFRFNYLPVVTDGSQLQLSIDSTAAQGTPLSAVNLLVNGDVALTNPTATVGLGANGTAVTGVDNTPNTHLVLQSSGNIQVGNGGDYYWPGYVYLGNVSADADGNALAGTLGFGTITTTGNFSNVLPGNLDGADGIHFITQFPLTLGGKVVTNANAWVNFGTDLLTQKYAGEQSATGPFFGGTQGSGKVVNYGVLDASNFVTQAPSADR